MKQKTVIILVVVFVVLLAGASVLYSQLSGSVDRDGLVVKDPASENAAVDEETSDEGENLGQDTPQSEESAQENPQDTEQQPQEPEKAPDFTVYDGEGNTHKLSDMLGKPVVLNFWASWCGPCQSEMPDFNEVYAELGDEVHFMMVNVTNGRETLESAKTFIAENGYSFPVYYDTDLDATMTYGATSLPTTFFIDAQGGAVAYGMGAMEKETLLQGIDLILPKDSE